MCNDIYTKLSKLQQPILFVVIAFTTIIIFIMAITSMPNMELVPS